MQNAGQKQKNTKIINKRICISCSESEISNINVVIAKAADELLNIKGIKASFVLSKVDECIFISARAISDINVQRAMELLGGGGHLGIAGAQIKDATMEEAKEQLKNAIRQYIEEGETK